MSGLQYSIQEYIRKMLPHDGLDDGKECLRQQEAECNKEEDNGLWKDKSLYGMYHWQMEKLADIRKSYQ